METAVNVAEKVADATTPIITPEMAKIPAGPLAEKWTNYKDHQKLVNPANKRRLDVIVVGTGLAGASAAATLAELGFNVLNFCIRVVTTAPVRRTCTAWLRLVTILSTSVWHKVFLLLANTAVCSTTVRSVALR